MDWPSAGFVAEVFARGVGLSIDMGQANRKKSASSFSHQIQSSKGRYIYTAFKQHPSTSLVHTYDKGNKTERSPPNTKHSPQAMRCNIAHYRSSSKSLPSISYSADHSATTASITTHQTFSTPAFELLPPSLAVWSRTPSGRFCQPKVTPRMADALAQSPLPKSRPARLSRVLKNKYFARSRPLKLLVS